MDASPDCERGVASQGYVVTGELLICCYNVLLHQATFEEPGLAP